MIILVKRSLITFILAACLLQADPLYLYPSQKVIRKPSQLGLYLLKALVAKKDGYHINASELAKLAEKEIQSGIGLNDPIHLSQSVWWRPIHFAIAMHDIYQVFSLIQAGCNIEALDSRGRTPLIACLTFATQALHQQNKLAFQNLSAIAKLLIYRGADLHGQYQRRSVIDWSLTNPEIVSLILTKNWHLSSPLVAKTVLSKAYRHAYHYRHSYPKISKLLLKTIHLLIQNKIGVAERIIESPKSFSLPLHYAIALQKPKHVELLLNSGADPKQKDSCGISPLSSCLYHLKFQAKSEKEIRKDLTMAKALLQNGANLRELFPGSQKTLYQIIAYSIPELHKALKFRQKQNVKHKYTQ